MVRDSPDSPGPGIEDDAPASDAQAPAPPAPSAEPAPAAPDINARIDALEKAVNQIQSQLSDLQAKIESSGTRKAAKQLDEVLQKLKAHQHDREDGKAYILEKKEI